MLLHFDASPPARDVNYFLREANRRIRHFQEDHNIPGFVPSDHLQVYQALRFIAQAHCAPGNHLCEWGSGFGVVACLGAMTGYFACGIEIDLHLVEAARQLAVDFDLQVEFYHDSFIPYGGEKSVEPFEATGWLTTHAGTCRQDWGLCPENFDVIFAYPWPGEEEIIETLFEESAGTGALLLTYHGQEGLRLQRKIKRSRQLCKRTSSPHSPRYLYSRRA